MKTAKASATDEILKNFVRELKAKLGPHLERVVLFGSRARGDYKPDSDYDCLALLDEVSPELKESIFEVTGEFLYQYNAVFAVIPVTEKRYREEAFLPLFTNIRREGIAL